ncbi:MAG: hypothetical protein M9887_02950 [Chitinophagales bacterium]|nr:hypothetical protein [Chitinophagales bacterium]
MAEKKEFVASAEVKGQAKQLRVFAMIAWIVAIAGEVFAILKLISNDMMMWLIGAVVVILALSITGSLLWKKANRLDPASEKNKAKFFIQSQLGAIMAAIAFLPLIVLVLMNKNLDRKSKGIVGAVAALALLIGVGTGVDYAPPSIEKYTEQINEQTDLITDLTNGVDRVYWTPSGNKLHIFDDCQHIKNSEVSEGTVKEAWEARKIDNNEVCKTCINRAEKLRGADNSTLEHEDVTEEVGTE